MTNSTITIAKQVSDELRNMRYFKAKATKALEEKDHRGYELYSQASKICGWKARDLRNSIKI